MTDTNQQQAMAAACSDAPAGNEIDPTRAANDREPTASESSGGCGTSPRNGGGKSHVNFWLDTATALTFCAMVGSGLLLEFVLVRRGGASWLGWRRHDWGQIHFWLGVGLLTLVVTHLILHRQWIARCWKRFAGSLRSPVSWALLLSGLALMLAPLLIPVEPGGGGWRRRGDHAQPGRWFDVDRGDHQRPRRGRGLGRRSPGARGW